jgi:general stress protein 26
MREKMKENNLKKAIQSAKEYRKKIGLSLDEQEALSEGLKLVENSKICLLGTNGDGGFPNIKAMMNLKNEGLKKLWFSTNTSSKRVSQLRRDNRACVYYVDENSYRGLMLVGTMEILQDHNSRKMLWTDGAEVYYPLGIDDPDYSVLRFTAKLGNYYHRLKNITFEIE